MLCKEYNVSLLKPFFSEDTTENDEQTQLQKSNRDEKHDKQKEEEHLHDKSYYKYENNKQEIQGSQVNKLLE